MTRIRQATVRVLAGVLLVVSSLLIATTPSAAAVPPVFTSLTMQNGWTTAVAGTGNAGATVIYNNIVHLKGTIKTTGTSRQPFTLPTAFRPATNVYVAVSLCGGDGGRLFITPQGVVTVQARNFAKRKMPHIAGRSVVREVHPLLCIAHTSEWLDKRAFLDECRGREGRLRRRPFEGRHKDRRHQRRTVRAACRTSPGGERVRTR